MRVLYSGAVVYEQHLLMECAATDSARAAFPVQFTQQPQPSMEISLWQRDGMTVAKFGLICFLLSGHHHGANRQRLMSLEDFGRPDSAAAVRLSCAGAADSMASAPDAAASSRQKYKPLLKPCRQTNKSITANRILSWDGVTRPP